MSLGMGRWVLGKDWYQPLREGNRLWELDLN
jgi:hypothetical protein